MSKRERVIFLGTLVGGVLGATVAYLLAPPKEPGEEESPSLLAGIGLVEGLAIARAAFSFIRQIRSVRQKGVTKRHGAAR
ncbi:MAG: YtxH domain-containing protein [Anaerolineae bacterium]|jgi:hypothetical protein|nr:YtxH domain-containing protein [Anaerolineae bacterium]